MQKHSLPAILISVISLILLTSVAPANVKANLAFDDMQFVDNDTTGSDQLPKIHPSHLEYWPLLYGQYDVQAFLDEINSPLAYAMLTTPEGGQISASSEIERIGSRYNIHPRILLVSLEVDSGLVDGYSTRGSSAYLLESAVQIDVSSSQSMREQLEVTALNLRRTFDRWIEHRWQASDHYHTDNIAPVLIAATATQIGTEMRYDGDLRLFLTEFLAQYESWFSALNLAVPEALHDWENIESYLPYRTGSYTGAPHGSTNLHSLSGLDFKSDNGTILNIADGWLLEKRRRGGGVGNYVKIQINNTEYAVEYWHLTSFSNELNSLQVGKSFIPAGFPLGTQGGTTNVHCTDSKRFDEFPCKSDDPPATKLASCKQDSFYGRYYTSVDEVSSECLYASHIHLQLVALAVNQPATGVTWDNRRLDDWYFFVDTSTENRAFPRPYQGSAVLSGTTVKNVFKQQIEENNKKVNIYSIVGTPETDANTKYATTTLSSNNEEANCTTATCLVLPPPVIESPTGKAILQAGPHNNPAQDVGPIKVLVDKQFNTLSTNDFSVRIGGKPATIQGEVTLAGAYNRYEIIIDPPTQPTNGLYDLQVDVKGTTVTSAKSIRYGELQGAAYVVILDTSGSMNCSLADAINARCDYPVPNAKIYSAREVSESFVVRLQADEEIGLIRFQSGRPNVRDGEPKAAVPGHQQYLSNILRTVEGAGGTPLYKSIEEAVSKLANHPSPIRTVVVLSDGEEDSTYGTSIDDAITAAQRAGVQVCTVRFGDAANLAVLNQISKETGCVAAQTALDPNQLEQALTSIRTSTSNLQTINTVNALLQPGQSQQHLFTIDNLAEAVFQLIWQNVGLPGNRLILKLIAPDGTEYTPDQLHGAEYISGSAIGAFRILRPQSGVWRLLASIAPVTSAQAAHTANSGIPIEFSVTGNADLKLRTYAPSLVEAGKLLELGINLANPAPITEATVLVSIQRPSGSTVLLPLLDDGNHGDGLANDGYYSAAFYDTFQTGTYRLEYLVDGALPDSTPFQRYGRRTLEVQGNAGQGLGIFTLKEGLNLVGLNGLAPVGRSPGAALLSITDAYTGVLSYNYQDGGLGYFADLPEEINTLKEIDPFQGYWIRTTKPVTLQVTGPNLLQDHYIPVHPGWNLVPYLSAAATPITEALSSLEGQYLSVRGYKNGAMSYWPQLPSEMNTLQVMEPGLGYWIQMSDVHTILQYPMFVGGPPAITETAVLAQAGVYEQQRLVERNRPQTAVGVVHTEQWMDLYSFDVTINGQSAPAGTVVTVTDPRNQKVGEAVVQKDGQVGVLAVYGKSNFSNAIDGALPGDHLSIWLNGELATATDLAGNPIKWLADGTLQQIRIAASGERFTLDNKLYLPSVSR